MSNISFAVLFEIVLFLTRALQSLHFKSHGWERRERNRARRHRNAYRRRCYFHNGVRYCGFFDLKEYPEELFDAPVPENLSDEPEVLDESDFEEKWWNDDG